MPTIHARCPMCNLLTMRDIDDPSPFTCQNETCAVDAAADRALRPFTIDGTGTIPRASTYPRGSWVYYLRFGDRVKIGTTVALTPRLSALPHDEVLALQPGSYELERATHAQFACDLVEGQREWFHISGTLQAHIAAIRDIHGDPHEIIRRESMVAG